MKIIKDAHFETLSVNDDGSINLEYRFKCLKWFEKYKIDGDCNIMAELKESFKGYKECTIAINCKKYGIRYYTILITIAKIEDEDIPFKLNLRYNEKALKYICKMYI